jgi:hypothetical protein
MTETELGMKLFEDGGRRPRSKEHRQLLKDEEEKETIVPKNLQKETPCQLQPGKVHFEFFTCRTVRG